MKARGEETDSELETDTEDEEARSTASGMSGWSEEEWSGESVDQWDVKQPS